MGTLVCSALIAKLRFTLLDPAPGTTFTDTDLRGALNEAQRAACELRPELFTKRAAIPMVAGTLQALPADGTVTMRLEENAVSKRRCHQVDAKLLDTANQVWPAATPEKDVQEYAVDPRDRKRFTVSPPNDGTGSVVALYGAVPPEMADVNATIALDDVFEAALLAYALHRAYSANTKRADPTKSAAEYARFKDLLGVNAQSVNALVPKVGTQGVN